MCGVNLVVEADARAAIAERMNAAIRHRGPDSSGVHLHGRFALGNVRLAIRDVAHGHQPMIAGSGVAVSFNGEVWNDHELREELIARGQVFHTDCDTEVVLRGYEEWGTGVFARLHADFAIIIVDPRRECALVARDRMGIKPLYYTHRRGLVAASSELKGLLTVVHSGPEAHRPLRSLTSADLYSDPELTEIAGFLRVQPGEFLEVRWEDNGPTLRRETYHRHDYRMHSVTEDEAATRLAALMEEAVRRQVVSERPVAVALSGGIDSSIVAAVASKYRPVMAYSIGTEGATETKQARELVDWLKERGHRIIGFREILINEETIARTLDDAVQCLESSYPIQADMAIVTTALASVVAGDGYRVLLSGEGADELFCGYHTYFQREHRAGRLAAALAEQVESLHRYNNTRLDKSCMAHGVEARVPFQHAPLVEYALGLPGEYKIGNPDPSNGQPSMQKYIQRRAAERMTGVNGGPLLPPEVIWRRKEYYAQGMDLPNLILRALKLNPGPGQEAETRFRAYKNSYRRVLLGGLPQDLQRAG